MTIILKTKVLLDKCYTWLQRSSDLQTSELPLYPVTSIVHIQPPLSVLELYTSFLLKKVGLIKKEISINIMKPKQIHGTQVNQGDNHKWKDIRNSKQVLYVMYITSNNFPVVGEVLGVTLPVNQSVLLLYLKINHWLIQKLIILSCFALLLLTPPVFWTRGTVFISVLYNTVLLWVAETQFKLMQQKWSVWLV